MTVGEIVEKFCGHLEANCKVSAIDFLEVSFFNDAWSCIFEKGNTEIREGEKRKLKEDSRGLLVDVWKNGVECGRVKEWEDNM